MPARLTPRIWRNLAEVQSKIFPIEKLREFCTRAFRATKPAPATKGPLIPGDPEREAGQVRRKRACR